MLTSLQPFNGFTYQLSEGGVPTLPMLLPLYKSMQQHLQHKQAEFKARDEAHLRAACQAGLNKLNKYLMPAQISKLHLLSAGKSDSESV